MNVRSYTNNFLIKSILFTFGFNAVYLSILLAFFYLLIKIPSQKNVKIKTPFLIIETLAILSTMPVYLIGYDRIALYSPLVSMILMVIPIVIGGVILQKQTQKMKETLILAYILGLSIEAMIITGYSMLSSNYGYGAVYNLFSGQEENSPIYSNILSLTLEISIYYLFFKKNFFNKIIIIMAIPFLISAGVFLGGRTFFIISAIAISAIAIFFITQKKTSIMKLMKAAMYILLIPILIYLIIFINPSIYDNIDFLISRFTNSGLESKRSELFIDGIQKLSLYPMGGFEIDPSIERTIYFHNIFLDNAKLGGWIPFLALILLTIYICYLIKKSKIKYNFMGFLIFMTTILIMWQDVTIEGNFRMFVLMVFSGIMFIKPIRKEVSFKLRER